MGPCSECTENIVEHRELEFNTCSWKKARPKPSNILKVISWIRRCREVRRRTDGQHWSDACGNSTLIQVIHPPVCDSALYAMIGHCVS